MISLGIRRRARRLGTAPLAAALLLGVAAGAAACGTGSNPAAASPVATSSIDLPPSYKFVPPAITVPAGTTVTWTNHDNFTHNVTFKDGGLPTDEHVVKPGESYSFAFTAPGTYHFQCTFHPQQMQGTVVVTQP